MGYSHHNSYGRSGELRSCTQSKLAAVRAILLLVVLLGVAGFGCRLSPPEASVRSADVEGIIVSSDGQPMEGVLIQAYGTGILTRSGVDGRFVLKGLPRGAIELAVGSDGQSTLTLEEFPNGMSPRVWVQLDENGDAYTIQVIEGSNSCASNPLTRPRSASGTSARGDVHMEKDADREEFIVSVSRVSPNHDYEVLLQEDPENRKSLVPIGLLRTHETKEGGEGQLALVGVGPDAAEAMPFHLSVTELLGRRISVRDADQGSSVLTGTVRILNEPEGPSINRRLDLLRVAGPDRARGSIRTMSTPSCDRDEFWVQVQGLERLVDYEICISCPTPSAARSITTTSGIPSLFLMDLTAEAGDAIEIPVILNTNNESIIFVQAVIEYDSNSLVFLDATTGSDAADWLLTTNPSLPFPPINSGSDENVLIQLVHPLGDSFNGTFEVARLRFQVSGAAAGTSCLSFDPCSGPDCQPPGLFHTVVTLSDGTPLSGSSGLNLVGGCITFQQFDCFQVTTSQGGEGHLFLRPKQCDILPCAVSCVSELGGAAVEIRDHQGTVILEGRVPMSDLAPTSTGRGGLDHP